MKWILITYICSVATGECPSNSITGFNLIIIMIVLSLDINTLTINLQN